jgi:iron complex outermembrane recepter protein
MDYYRIRGFDASYSNTFLDGLLAEGAPFEELWAFERIEVVKGPASTLFGQGPLGGFVNLVSKRPRPDFFGEVQFTGGSFDYYQGAFDINSPFNKDRTIYARLNALFRSAGSFVDFAGSKRIFVAPAFTWEITPSTSFTLLTSYRDDWIYLAFPLPARGTVLPNPNGEIPISRYIGNPAHPNDEWERIIRVGYEFNHRFNESIGLIQNFRYFWLDWTSNNLSYPQFLSEDGRILTLQGYRATGNYYGWRIDTAADFAFGTGPFDHIVLLGVDYRSTTQDFTSQDANQIELDVFTPNYDTLPAYVYGPKMTSKETYGDLGIYLQDQIKLLKNVTLTAGIRYDYSYFDIPIAFGTDESGGYFSEYAFSPRVGIT